MLLVLIIKKTRHREADVNGQRFQVVCDLLDEIHARAPETRIGITAFGARLWFYDRDNTNLFLPILKDSNWDQWDIGAGAVIPPLHLDSIYTGKAAGFPSGTVSYTKTGIDVLKMYLQTRSSSLGTQLAYTPTHTSANPTAILHNNQSTGITIAFEGTKLAHLSQTPPLKPNRHFNIFFSDGMATQYPNDPNPIDGYVQGTNCPTTFTVYYGNSTPDIAKLQTMTTNIKNNGYSDKNLILTEMLNLKDWTIIKQKLNALFGKILTNTTGTPNLITIGTSTSSMWDSTGFTCKDLFPLQIGPTPFTLDIKVHLKKDSLNDQGQVISTVEKDTLLKYAFKVVVAPDAAIPDSMIMKWWDRGIGWYNNGAAITSANSDMNNLEMRFAFGRIDTLYNYSEAIVEVSTAKSKDLEKYSLDKTGAFFSKPISHKTGPALVNNGILEHAADDSLIAVFRNKLLPLDTMRIAIPYSEGYLFTLDRGALYDMNADGKVDKVTIGLKGNRVADFALSMADTIANHFPPLRKLAVVGTPTVSDAGLTYSVVEGATAVQTATTPDDTVSIVKDTIIFPNRVYLLKSKIALVDSMAPIAVAAKYIDSIKFTGKDELIVDFSETMTGGNATTSFVFIKQTTNINFGATLDPKSASGKTARWFVKTITGGNTIVQNDSLRISESSDIAIADDKVNKQLNSANKKCPINVQKIPDGIAISSAVYFDDDANGRIDRIVVRWSQEVGVIAADEITKRLSLPAVRAFTMQNGSTVQTNGITLLVSEGSPAVNTAVAPDEIVSVTDTIVFSATLRVVPSSAQVTDSLGPVIMNAQFTEGSGATVEGRLSVAFSEAVSQTGAA